jgi:hypothetical protein
MMLLLVEGVGEEEAGVEGRGGEDSLEDLFCLMSPLGALVCFLRTDRDS